MAAVGQVVAEPRDRASGQVGHMLLPAQVQAKASYCSFFLLAKRRQWSPGHTKHNVMN